LVDPRTGELHNIPTTTPYAFLGPHTQVDKERINQISESRAFTPGDKFLILWWVSVSPPGTAALQLTGADIAKRVGMTSDAVGRIHRKLAKLRILILAGRIGNYPLYRMSPYIAFHGTGAEQREAIKNLNPPEIPSEDPKKRRTKEAK
jgi:hypothetical protein